MGSLSGIEELFRAASLIEGERGVYRIENSIDGRSYIGSSSDVGKRLRGHITQLRNGAHPNQRLGEGWRRNGPTAFKVSLIERVPGPGLRERERFHIQLLDTYRHGYNQTADGEGATPLPASERSRLGLDGLPPERPAQGLLPAYAKEPSRPSPEPKSTQGCLLLVLCSAGFVGFGIWELTTQSQSQGEQIVPPKSDRAGG